MIENFNLLLIAGGRYFCGPDWGRDAEEWDNCFKLYAPVRGGARLMLDGEWHDLAAGNIYIFSGFRLQRYECSDEMDVIWVHFMPKSLQMRWFLDRSEVLHSWAMSDIPFGVDNLEIVSSLFDNPWSDSPSLRSDHPDQQTCMVNSLLLYFISDILGGAGEGYQADGAEVFKRLEPAMNFINSHYLESPSLSEIAKKANMVPNYFHRVFKKTFNVTPHVYMTRRRLDEARQLLATTDLTIREIALQTGYDNEFYFSRVFKKQINMSPSKFRKTAVSA